PSDLGRPQARPSRRSSLSVRTSCETARAPPRDECRSKEVCSVPGRWTTPAPRLPTFVALAWQTNGTVTEALEHGGTKTRVDHQTQSEAPRRIQPKTRLHENSRAVRTGRQRIGETRAAFRHSET